MKTVLIGLAVCPGRRLAVVLLLASGFSREIARAEARLAGYPPGRDPHRSAARRPGLRRAWHGRRQRPAPPSVSPRPPRCASSAARTGRPLSARQTIAEPRARLCLGRGEMKARSRHRRAGDRQLCRRRGTSGGPCPRRGAHRCRIRTRRRARRGAALSRGTPLDPGRDPHQPRHFLGRDARRRRPRGWKPTGGPAEILFTFDAAGDIATMTRRGPSGETRRRHPRATGLARVVQGLRRNRRPPDPAPERGGLRLSRGLRELLARTDHRLRSGRGLTPGRAVRGEQRACDPQAALRNSCDDAARGVEVLTLSGSLRPEL